MKVLDKSYTDWVLLIWKTGRRSYALYYVDSQLLNNIDRWNSLN